MKKQILICALGAAAILSLDSCTHYYYVGNQHNVPLFKEKNEVRISGALIRADEVTGGDVQAAYAVSKEAAIMANACIISPASHSGRGQLYELGAGYFKPIPSSNLSVDKRFVFETYGVVGVGSAKNYYNQNYPDYNVSTGLLKAYIQPDIGFTTNFIDIILSAKIGMVHTFGIHRNMPDSAFNATGPGTDGNRTVVDDVRILTANRTSFLFEPAATLRVGFKYVKAHFQVGYSVIAGDFSRLASTPSFDIGITVAIAKRFKLKTDRPAKEKWKEMFD